jgi:hypothetical protein
MKRTSTARPKKVSLSTSLFHTQHMRTHTHTHIHTETESDEEDIDSKAEEGLSLYLSVSHTAHAYTHTHTHIHTETESDEDAGIKVKQIFNNGHDTEGAPIFCVWVDGAYKRDSIWVNESSLKGKEALDILKTYKRSRQYKNILPKKSRV